MGFFDFLFGKKTPLEKRVCETDARKYVDSKCSDNNCCTESNECSTPFPDRRKLIKWTIDKIKVSINNGDVELVNKQYANLIELVRQQNINENGALDDFLNSIRGEYDSFREKFLCEYPQELLPPQERNNNEVKINDDERIELHNLQKEEVSNLKMDARSQEAIEELKNAMSREFPYNNHSYYWQKISSLYFKNKDMENYLYAITMSVFYCVIHYYTIIGDKRLVNDFYKTQSVEYVGLTNMSRFVKQIHQPNFIDKYNSVLMPFFNEIKPLVLETCKFRANDKFTKKEMDFFNKYTLEFFDNFYNEKIKCLLKN